jgi:hypothetical protein
MAQQRLIQAIGRIERALSRIERVPASLTLNGNADQLAAKHDALKAETRSAIRELDAILSSGTN